MFKEIPKIKIILFLILNSFLIYPTSIVFGIENYKKNSNVFQIKNLNQINKQNDLSKKLLNRKTKLSYNTVTNKILERARGSLDKNKYQKAIELYEKYIFKVKKVFGEESSHLIHPLNELAIAYDEIGKPNIALRNYLKAIEINTKFNGEINEDNGIFYENIGILNWNLNKYSDAEKNFKKSIEIYGKIYKKQKLN